MASKRSTISELIDEARRLEAALCAACDELEIAEQSGDAKRLKRAEAAEERACHAVLKAEDDVIRAAPANARDAAEQLRFVAWRHERALVPDADVVAMLRRVAAVLEARA